jgi:hypothetical protein
MLRQESRLQLQGELQSDAVKKYRGVFHGIKVILQNEGPKGLFRGIGCAVCDLAADPDRMRSMLTSLSTHTRSCSMAVVLVSTNPFGPV